MSIEETVRRIKASILEGTNAYLAPILIILVGFAGFGLGRLSALEEHRPPLDVRETGGGATLKTALYEVAGVVASKNGGKYHLPWCAGAGRIAEGNKVWFASAAEARGAGYEPALNCPGLE